MIKIDEKLPVRNLKASTSWNPQGLSRPVMGLLYLSVSQPFSKWGPLLLVRVFYGSPYFCPL
jgi:hypothetical protein